jgi:3-deoxy-D-manno-octulosonic-acid transferase
VFALYSALLFVGLLVTSPYWLVQMLRLGKYRAGLSERLGFLPRRILSDDTRPVIWVHAVSVGEVLAIQGLVAGLRSALPDRRIVISTTTHTGQKLARERFGGTDVFYFPLDLAVCILPYFRALRPTLVILAETEFWPNFLRTARKSGARVAVVNGRISDRSFPRYEFFRGLLAQVLEFVDLFLAQSEEDARRLFAIGAPQDRVHVSGNLKFDVKPPEEAPIVSKLRGVLAREQAGPVIVAGSTVEGEEDLVLDAFRFLVVHQHPQAVLILAPRHKERFEEVARRLGLSGVKWSRRSQMSGNTVLAGSVLLLDSLGELASVYALADVAFVGGSLAPRGGHNILEPAHWGVATVVGPHTENFRDIIGIFRQAHAVRVVARAAFGPTLLSLLANDETRRALGERARGVVIQQAGATQRTLAEIRGLLMGGGR